MTNNNAWYYILPDIFKYLEVHELLKAAQVCRMWCDSAADLSLWKTVRLTKCRVTDWKALTNTLKRSGTKLKVLNAMSIESNYLNLKLIDNLKECQELRLRAEFPQRLVLHDLTPLQNLTQLKHLVDSGVKFSLTSICHLGIKNVDVIQVLTKLETLELGDCTDWPRNFGTNVLQKLKNLKRLRLEVFLGSVTKSNIFQTISKLKDLSHVELTGCSLMHCETIYSYLGTCKYIKKLLITTCHTIDSIRLHGILRIIHRLSETLTHFVFGVPIECNRNEIFCDINKQNKESISVIESSDLINILERGNLTAEDMFIKCYSEDTLPYMQKLLLTVLPKTRITIFKINSLGTLCYYKNYFAPRISDIVT